MRTACLALAGIALLVSCSGGGTGGAPRAAAASPTPSPAPAATTTSNATNAHALAGTLTLTFPRAGTPSLRRHRTFLSPSASSVAIAVTGEPVVVADISQSSTQCTAPAPSAAPSSFGSPPPAAAAMRTCSIPVLAPVGSDTFTATLYDGANATGTVLGTGSATQSISTTFSVQISVSGVPSSVAVSITPATFTIGTAATATVSVAVSDADGNVISGTYANPITLTDSDASGTFTLSTTAIASSTTAVQLTYSGAATPDSATISATAAGVVAANVTPQTVTAVPPNLYTAEYDPAVITVTADNASGNAAPGRSIDTTAAGLYMLFGMAVDARGLAYVSGDVSGDGSGDDEGGTPRNRRVRCRSERRRAARAHDRDR